jgi:hypothetical protein
MSQRQSGTNTLPGVSDELANFFTEKSNEFSSARKQRGKALPQSLASADTIKDYKQLSCYDILHSTGNPGITSLDLQV